MPLESSNPKVSIIIPAYGVEPYLEQCLRSVLEQTYTNLEIVLVISISDEQDSCLALASKTAAGDNRVIILTEAALGVSHARNTGLANARGDYIAFVDSDDYVEPTYIETLVSLSLKSDGVAMCGYQMVGGNDQSNTDLSYGAGGYLSGREVCSRFFKLKDRVATCVLWNKMYRRDVFTNLDTFPNVFPVGKINEDETVMPRLLYSRKQIWISPDTLYSYRYRRKGSIMSEFTVNHLACIDAHIARRNFLESQFDEELVALADFYLFNDAGYFWCRIEHIEHEREHDKRLKFVMMQGFRQVMTDVRSKWWARPLAVLFLCEFWVWKRFLQVKSHVQTH